VVGCIVTSYLYARYPEQHEGFLTKMKNKLVSSDMLSFLAKCLRFEQHIKHRLASLKQNILEDVFESFVGAIHLTWGFEVVQSWVVSVLEKHVDFSKLVQNQENPKDLLIRYCMNYYGYKPTTVFASDGSVQFQTPKGVVIFSYGACKKGNKATEYQAAQMALESFGMR
jgi:ribonuclease III